MAVGRLSALGAGFVLGFASAVLLFTYLIVVLMLPEASWWKLIPMVLAAPVFAFLAGGFGGVALAGMVDAYQFRKGWIHCATCGDRLTRIGAKCSCHRESAQR